jgi:hypothetical protein
MLEMMTTNTPLAILAIPKPIGRMTDAERRAFADRIFDTIAKARVPNP